MRGSSLFLVQVVTMFAVKAVNSAPVKKNSLQGSPTTGCNAEPTNNCNCHCNVFQDSRITKAVNALENKVDQFIEVVNDTAPPGLSPDPWIKINTAPVCFGAKGDQFGKFFVPTGGRLASIKLVHFYGYVTCDKRDKRFWSYWGCSTYLRALQDKVNVVITNSSNHILLPSSQFMYESDKWSILQGYNSFSPEIVLSVFSNPLAVVKGQELRLWFGEDLVNRSEGDNDGKSCCDVYARLVGERSLVEPRSDGSVIGLVTLASKRNLV